MWQRIQTLYIGIATALTAAMFFCRMATIIGPEGNDIDIRYYEKLPYLMMLIMLLTAGICAVFTYKSRLLQARVCILTALMLIGFQIWLGIDFIRYHNDMVFSITLLFPIVSAILNAIAARGNLVDEMTLQAVKSAKKARKKKFIR
ncbi:MAG: DUF4293 family protein [Bacteroidales bacterium]|nr:DUF4293 family protein [Bacteroidales bacterium]